MRSWIKIEGGVRKFHDWGESEVFMPFPQCFTDRELDQVILELSSLKDTQGSTAEELKDLTELIAERKTRKG